MARRTMPLKDTDIRKAKAADKEYFLRDGDGLVLAITTGGKKIWRLKYILNKKENTISLGQYPDVSLADARIEKDKFRKMISNGQDPSLYKKHQKHLNEVKRENTFEAIAISYMEHRSDLNESYAKRTKRALERDFFPFLTNRNIDDIKPLEMLEIIKRIEQRGAVESSHRLFTLIDRIYRYAVTIGRAERNIMADVDKNLALKAHKHKNLPNITNVIELQILLKLIEDYKGDFATKQALRLAPYIFVRPFNIRYAEWDEFDIENKIWKIPADKMKMKLTHIVPLTDSMIKIIKETEPFSRHRSKYLFPSPTDTKRTVSENTLGSGLKRMGYNGQMTVHGFRHTASTLLHENMHKHGVHSEAIEVQMAHVDGSMRGIYNHAKYLEERIRLMNWWSDFIDHLKENG
jgi:integrase